MKDLPMSAMRLFATTVCVLAASVGQAQSLQTSFDDHVRPFTQSYCVGCHNGNTTEGDLDLTVDDNLASVLKNFRHWSNVQDRLQAGEMPPKGSDRLPTPQERAAVIAWIEQVKVAEATRTKGDPGIVLPHRLSSSEYNYTIADLTGADIQPAAAFPVDPANEAGFDNSGESLAMSPALLKKYFDAASEVAEHLALTPSGFEFAPHPVSTPTDRDKFCVNRIIDFYRRQRTDYAEYFEVLWRHQNRGLLGRADWPLECLANQQGLSERYVQRLWELLGQPPRDGLSTQAVGPIAALRLLLRELPDASTPENISAAQSGCQAMASFVEKLRQSLVPAVPNLTAPQMNNGSQPLVLWKNRQFVANRRSYIQDELPQGDFGLAADSAAARLMEVTEDTNSRAYQQSLAQFCDTFPDAFFVSERARVYLDQKDEKKLTGRFLSAGFHSQMGYFRDDAPLYDLMLDDTQRQEIDRLWLELDFVAKAPMRQYSGLIWFDRTDSGFMRDRVFDRYRAEDKDNISVEKVAGLASTYLEKAKRVGASDQALEAIAFYFDDMNRTFRRLERLEVESQPLHLDALVEFAQRAFRRPLSQSESDSIRSFYDTLRRSAGLSHEEAIRDGVVAVLMSPHFCYRIHVVADQLTVVADQATVVEGQVTVVADQATVLDEGHPATSSDAEAAEAEAETAAGAAIRPLSDFSLASRLSYFLWSSMPDQKLLALAGDGRLRDPAMMLQQSRRMLADDRVDRFVIEFAGNWLDFRRFSEHNGVDRERFPAFTDELRQAMADEPKRFFRDLIARDGSVLDFLYAQHTFVNPVLGTHYGRRPDSSHDSAQQWVRWDQAGEHGRGGLLPMAVFLTSNSSGLRTSPVQRGHWLVKQILGEKIPAPPATVPELPSDESQLGDWTLRETLARHRQDIACAGCHNRMDSMGLVFEGYGPIGEYRESDLGGRVIDDSAVFPDDSQGSGLGGVLSYIRQSRQDDFVDNLCRKLLAFALGRTLQLSDNFIIAEMKRELVENDYRFSAMIEVIVTSPAFLNKRVNIPLSETAFIP